MKKIRRNVTGFRELRAGVPADRKTKLKVPNARISTAAMIRLVTHGLSQATHFVDIVLCVGQSVPMASSVVDARVFAALLVRINAVSTLALVFDTALPGLAPVLSDPVEVLLGPSLAAALI